MSGGEVFQNIAAAVASAWPPPSSYSRQSANRPRSACQSCPYAIAPPDGSTAPPCYWLVRHPRPARTSTTPRAASASHGMSLRCWAHHTDSPLPRGVPPPGEAGSYTTETSSVAGCPRAPNATTQTSGAPAPARRHRSPQSAHHGCASLRNRVTHAPSTPAAAVPDTSCTHCTDLSPGCRRIAPPTAREPPAPHVTSAPETPSRGSSRPPTARRACPLGASWSHRGGPQLVLGRKRGLPPRARRPPRSWPSPTG